MASEVVQSFLQAMQNSDLDAAHSFLHPDFSLQGTWLDGQSFQGIRFIDRIQLQYGLIMCQDVWNDLT